MPWIGGGAPTPGLSKTQNWAHPGVYFICGISADRDARSDRGQDSVFAVNLTKELGHVSPFRKARCAAIVGNRKVFIRHFDGGPCNGLHAFSCMRFVTKEAALEGGAKILDQQAGDRPGSPHVLVISGTLSDIVDLAHKDWEMENQRRGICSRPEPELAKRMVHLAWGDGHWSRTQLIGEIARGGWGMCKFSASDVFETPTSPTPPSPHRLFSNLHAAQRPLAPNGQNPMTRAMNEPLEVRPFADTDAASRHRQELRKQLMENHRKAQEKLEAQKRANREEEAERKDKEESTPEDMQMTPQSNVSTAMLAVQSPLPMEVGSPAIPSNNPGPPLLSLSLSSRLPHPPQPAHLQHVHARLLTRHPHAARQMNIGPPAQFPQPPGGDINPENF